MKINEKIRFIRELKGWSQEEMAEKLNMSSGGYANIERGGTDIQYSRLEQISKILDTKLSELTDLEEKNFQVFLAGNDIENQVTIHPSDTQLQHQLEKAQLTIKQQQQEILYLKQEVINLKEIIELIKKK
ncbi:helix-turn-helix transcriptional regulator [Candidatus Halobeggiatoa sp. HSG11]|nr:helix-turn-helix transcriptional regulator [Candidatus Halobeggiatoa sp. HSG11]